MLWAVRSRGGRRYPPGCAARPAPGINREQLFLKNVEEPFAVPRRRRRIAVSSRSMAAAIGPASIGARLMQSALRKRCEADESLLWRRPSLRESDGDIRSRIQPALAGRRFETIPAGALLVQAITAATGILSVRLTSRIMLISQRSPIVAFRPRRALD